ncbi:hypothetical protein [Methyloprofundus sp.]|uniref:hypothetical protein n=1 Tax=Methyloprofundus sp. TaxID=2020875 RepID=UPI003D0B9733
MKKAGLLGTTLIVSVTFCLNSCENSSETEHNKYTETNDTVAVIGPQSEGLVDNGPKEESRTVVESTVNTDAQESKILSGNNAFTDEIDVVTEEVQQDQPVALDFSLNFEQLELQTFSDVQAGYDRRVLLRGIFESEDYSTNIEIETHFEGPHVENKERDATPDGVGIDFKIGF